jgi:hypothetical protein
MKTIKCPPQDFTLPDSLEADQWPPQGQEADLPDTLEEFIADLGEEGKVDKAVIKKLGRQMKAFSFPSAMIYPELSRFILAARNLVYAIKTQTPNNRIEWREPLLRDETPEFVSTLLRDECTFAERQIVNYLVEYFARCPRDGRNERAEAGMGTCFRSVSQNARTAKANPEEPL